MSSNNSQTTNSAAPKIVQNSQKWSSGLFDCCQDPSNCLMTLFCPLITFGRNVEIIDRGKSSPVQAAGIFYLLDRFGFAFIRSYPYRTKLRSLYSLPEEPCGDCCVHCCCIHCALCQEHRELKSRGLDPCLGWAANVEKMNGIRNGPPKIEPGMSRD